MRRTLRQAVLAAVHQSDLRLKEKLLIYGGLLRPATATKVYALVGEHCQAAGYIPYTDSVEVFTADSAINAIDWDAIIKFIKELIPLIQLLIGLFPPASLAATEEAEVYTNWTKSFVAIVVGLVLLLGAGTAMAHGPSDGHSHYVTASIPQGYQPRWSNHDGLSFYEHARVAHGIDVRGKSYEEVAWLRDQQHDRYGAGHPFALPSYHSSSMRFSQRSSGFRIFRRFR